MFTGVLPKEGHRVSCRALNAYTLRLAKKSAGPFVFGAKGRMLAAVSMPSTRVLVLFAHPAFEKSRINRRLAAAAHSVAGVTFHDLYERYPDFHIDVAHEQGLLLAHDVIVFQHPFYWYSCPALLKEWLDLVLEHGFAYGARGTKLQGKHLLTAITAGGPAAAYTPEGYNHFTIRELLAPFEQTALLCGMRWLPPFVVHGAIRLTDPAAIERHAADYAALLTRLTEGKIPAALTR